VILLLRTYFTPDGPRTIPLTEESPQWMWGMSLRAWGFEGSARPVSEARLSARANRIEYKRGVARCCVLEGVRFCITFALDDPLIPI